MKFAVIKTGGKQYVVTEGQKLNIEKLATTEKTVTFDKVLLVHDGDKTLLGKPYLETTVAADLTKQFKGEKVRIEKYKPKVRYHKAQGHRQLLTEVKITKIN